MLRDKKILLIAPNFFDYEIEIKNELELKGAYVDYLNERPSNSFVTKSLIRLGMKALIQKNIDDHYKSILENSKQIKYDYVIMVNIEAITEKIICELRAKQPEAFFVLYMWDSIKNKKRAFDSLNLFDSVYTFDESDISLNEKIKFRPLFYINDYKELKIRNDYVYDLCFIGTAHSDRYHLLEEIKTKAEEYGLNVYFYYYFPSRIFFFFRKLLDKSFRNASYKDFSFNPLKKEQIIDIINQSKCIIDIQHPNQTGLTMRTIEVLGAKRKLITTNDKIKDYDFYNSDNILVLDRKQPELNREFINSSYKLLDHGVYKRYSIDLWLDEILK